MKLSYYSQQQEDLSNEKQQFINPNNNYSIRVQYHSDSDQPQIPNKNNIRTNNHNHYLQTNNNNHNYYYYQNQPFFVKYHCQRIKLKSLVIYSSKTSEQLADIRITLLRQKSSTVSTPTTTTTTTTTTTNNNHTLICNNYVNNNNNQSQFTQLQHVWLTVNCNQYYLQHRQIIFPNPQCASFKLLIFNCPQIQYSQLYHLSTYSVNNYNNNHKHKKINDNNKQQLLLQQIRKMVKKQRYQTFILKKQLSDVLKQSTTTIQQTMVMIKLPLHFVQKQNMSMDQVETNQLKFFKYLAFYEKYYTSENMLKQQMQHINVDKITIIKQFVDSFQQNKIIFTVLEEKERMNSCKRFRNFVIQTISQGLILDNLLSKYSSEEIKYKKSKIKQIENSIVMTKSATEHVFEMGFVIDKSIGKKITNNNGNEKTFVKYPLVFRDVLIIQKPHIEKNYTPIMHILTKKLKRKKRYFIFAHGFQGLPIDLSFLINMIKFSNEKIKTFVLKSYKNHMEQSIEAMALRAATQIDSIFKKIDMGEIQPEITFIGHSMGPIILRASLPHLPHLTSYFSQFISLCSPHLGYIQGTKFLTQAGLSILHKLKPIQSLCQLSNRDNNNLEKTFIYKLSKQGSLKQFKRIVLIASMEDDYVPWHSARVEPFIEKGNKEKIERQMISNIFGLGSKQTKIQKIQRIQINFPHQKQKSLNSLIGRTCHIKPLTDRGFLEIFTKQLLQN